MPTIPPMQCEKPGNPPLDQAQMLRFGKRVDEYKLCVNEYARQMGAKGNEPSAAARMVMAMKVFMIGSGLRLRGARDGRAHSEYSKSGAC